jgi:ABC-2 type transport system ATP-binding protein
MNSTARALAIEVEGLFKSYEQVEALRGLTFQIEAGATTGLLGGNGAGKTTTIAILLGLLLPSAGRVSVLGEDMLRHRHRVLPRMNFSSPYIDLPRRLTVAENLRVYGHLYGLRKVEPRIRELAVDLEFDEFLKRPFGSLSSGQKTRVALAKSLLNHPELLMLDEPTASLDPDTADWVRGYLQNYQQETGATIVLASHNMAEVERMCADVLMLRGGIIVDRGAPQALIDKYGRANLEEVFLDIARGRDGQESGPDFKAAAQ